MDTKGRPYGARKGVWGWGQDPDAKRKWATLTGDTAEGQASNEDRPTALSQIAMPRHKGPHASVQTMPTQHKVQGRHRQP